MEPGECSWRKEVQECGGETTEGKVGSQWKGQINSPEVTIRERNWWQKVNQNTSFAEPKLICLTCQIHASKTSCEDSFDQVTEILYEALNWISDFFLHIHIPTATFSAAESWPPGTKWKTKVQFVPVSSKKWSLWTGDNRRGSDPLQHFRRSALPKLPQPPGGHKFSFQKSFLFFPGIREGKECVKKEMSLPPTAEACFVLKLPSPCETLLFHCCLLSPTKWLPFVPLAQDPKAGHTWLHVTANDE